MPLFLPILLIVLALSACQTGSGAASDASPHTIPSAVPPSALLDKPERDSLTQYFFEAGNSESIFFAMSPSSDRADAPLVLWLHGTPGSWADIYGILNTQHDVTWLSLDRPGWGNTRKQFSTQQTDQPASWQEHRQHYATFEQQVAELLPAIRRAMARHNHRRLIITGHSWGASLALALASEIEKNPEQLDIDLDGLVLFAGGYSPDAMAVRWYHRLANTRAGHWLMGDSLERATEEMLALPGNLQRMLTSWEGLNTELPIYLIQGSTDLLVPAENARWLQETWPDRRINVFQDPEFGHLWHFRRPEVIVACVEALTQSQPEQCANAVTAKK